MRSTEPACRRGEFLLMLLVAVAIVGILAGIVVPVLANKLDDAQLRVGGGDAPLAEEGL